MDGGAEVCVSAAGDKSVQLAAKGRRGGEEKMEVVRRLKWEVVIL